MAALSFLVLHCAGDGCPAYAHHRDASMHPLRRRLNPGGLQRACPAAPASPTEHHPSLYESGPATRALPAWHRAGPGRHWLRTRMLRMEMPGLSG